MRPSYIVLLLVATAAAALVALGPMRGESVQSGLADAADTVKSLLASSGGQGPSRAGGSPAAAPPELTVSQPIGRRVIEWDEYTGRFEAVQSVEIRARVSGYLDAVKFTDGEDVKAGDLLFTIDPRPYERALEQAKAQLNQAKVSVSNATLDVERGRPLLKRDYISRKAFDDRENLQRDAEALVKIAEARVKAAELDLSFCRITAPISGRISRTLVTPGNFVSGGGAEGASTILTTIVSQDPIYIYFDVSENNALKYQRLSQAMGKGTTGMLGASVGVGLPDETGFAHDAKLD
ncbi:MAG: efflux RND transporter periplasmic adaptor subunit, partial [Hyphomicrobium sp.]